MGAYQRYSKLGPREFREVVQIGFTACVLCFICLSSATVYAQQDASSAPGYQPTSLSISPFTRNVATSPSNIRVGLISSNGGISRVENVLHNTGLLDSSRIRLINNNGGTPTLAHLQAYDMLLLWTDSAFQDPVAVGDVLADFIDSGGGLVIATFAFSRGVYNRWWVGGRLLDEEYSPFGISDRRASASGTLNLAGASLDHPIFDGRIEVRDDVGEGVFSDIKKMVLVK